MQTHALPVRYAYASPEELNAPTGTFRGTTAAEVYSFAVTAWETLTGEVPWAGLSVTELVLAVCARQERPPLGGLAAASPFPFFAGLVGRCWDADPARRPSFGELATLFEEAAPQFEALRCGWKWADETTQSQSRPKLKAQA